MSDGEQGDGGNIQSPALQRRSPGQMKYHFIKSNFFRVIHVDGVWGGLTPGHDIQMALFNERQPIPKSQTISVTEDGLKEISKESRIGVVREIEVEVVMDLGAAKSLRAWLDAMITQAEKVQEAIDKGDMKVVSQMLVQGAPANE